MSEIQQRECLNCGMAVSVAIGSWRDAPAGARCPKCDSDLLGQSDGSILNADIAHQRETVAQAMDKMDRVLEQAWRGYYQSVRLIVGGGLIREEVLSHLYFLERQGDILDLREEGLNPGAVLVRLR